METSKLSQENDKRVQKDTAGETSVFIRPAKLIMANSNTRFPFHGKVGTKDGMSLLRYRRAPELVAPKKNPDCS